LHKNHPEAAVWKSATEEAVTSWSAAARAALRFKPHRQITFAAQNLLNTNSESSDLSHELGANQSAE
jgi:hypothetical protein